MMQGTEARSWASHRGQTLTRTVNGIMLYQRALRLLAELEEYALPLPGQLSAGVSGAKLPPTPAIGSIAAASSALVPAAGHGLPEAERARLEEVLRAKFNYVVSCQVYGQQKKNGDKQAFDIDQLLIAHPNLRIGMKAFSAS